MTEEYKLYKEIESHCKLVALKTKNTPSILAIHKGLLDFVDITKNEEGNAIFCCYIYNSINKDYILDKFYIYKDEINFKNNPIDQINIKIIEHMIEFKYDLRDNIAYYEELHQMKACV